jgi:hypothetical protein
VSELDDGDDRHAAAWEIAELVKALKAHKRPFYRQH